jgi:hypothetical protein
VRNTRCHFNRFGKAVIAALLIGMILMLDAMAACPALHELIHKDADCPEHHCAVTTLAHGKIESATCEIIIPPPTVLIETTKHFTISVFSPAIENLPHGRAPPVFFSVS